MIRQGDEEVREKKEEVVVSTLLCKKIKPCELRLGRQGRKKHTNCWNSRAPSVFSCEKCRISLKLRQNKGGDDGGIETTQG